MNKKLTTLAILSVICQSCTVIYREVKYGEPGIDAYKIFPYDTIKPGAAAFHFKTGNLAVLDEPILHAEEVKKIRTIEDSSAFTLDYFLKKTATTAFIVIRNDSVLFERYYRGYDRAKISTIFSVSKSVTSLLVGLAVDDGYISSVRDPITRYIPELKEGDPRFEHLTVEDLLNMRSGLKFKESYSSPFSGMARHYYGTNQKGKIKKLKFETEPGLKFNYQSVCTALLGIAVENASGMPLARYLEEKIWIPLGMENGATWSLDDKRHRIAKAYGGLNTTVIDLAKIGRLYLHNGNWDGRQIVSAGWVKKSVVPDEHSNGYQYQWRTSRFYLYFFAYGFDGQVLGVCPDKNLIMVRLGEGEDFQSFMYLLSTKL
ncbi:MAG: serine hydrolase [Bacteroidetes bacterium]|nr:serine hydrolase [Bacteroidota bacterium]